MSFRVGLVVQNTTETNVMGRALWAESQGYEDLWVGDGGGRMHALTLTGAMAGVTRNARLGMGIVPVFTHSPAVLASALMTLNHIAPGRVVLGVGSSSQAMMENWNGIPFEKPLTRVKETVEVLRRMLKGEKVSFEGKSLRTEGFRLFWPMEQPPPIFMAALRPKMLETAGEIADGVILHLVPPRVLPRVLEHIRIGAERSGRKLEDLEIAVRINTYVTEDVSTAQEEFRQVALGYFSTSVYNDFLAWCGFQDEAKQISDGFQARNREQTQAAMTNALMDELAVIGDQAHCQNALREIAAAGVNTLIVNPASNHPDCVEATCQAFTPGNFQ